MGAPFPFPLAVLAGVSVFVPYIGPLVAMVPGLLLALCLTLHDMPILYGALDGDHVFLSRFGMPGVLTVIGGALMWRFAAALNTVDRFNAELHHRVASAEAAGCGACP